MTEELNENEVTEVTESEQEQIQAELERQEAEERAREQARIEHENFLKSFPDTTVFYQEIREEDGYKWLAGVVTNPESADKYKILDNNINMSELVQKNGRLYLKGYVAPDKTEAELIAEKANQIDKELEALLDATVQQRNYKNVESCVSYFNSTDDKYRTEAIAVNRWRDDLYRTAQSTLDKVRAGEIDWHTVDLDYIVSQVDPLDW